MKTIELIGIICLSLCALPQVFKSIRDKSSRGLSASFLWLWFFGEAFTLVYVTTTYQHDWLLIGNYALNLAGLCVLLYFLYFPKDVS